MDDRISGGCLCGKIEYTIQNKFEFVLFCHCKQCRQLSGSAHAANLFSTTETLKWSKGEESVKCFHHPKRDFTKAFCKECGSGLPYVSKNGNMVIVPAGSLASEPNIGKKAKVFLSERTNWSPSMGECDEFPGFPTYFDD